MELSASQEQVKLCPVDVSWWMNDFTAMPSLVIPFVLILAQGQEELWLFSPSQKNNVWQKVIVKNGPNVVSYIFPTIECVDMYIF